MSRLFVHGLTGVLVVGDRYDPATELVAVFSSPADSLDERRSVLINGRLDPVPLQVNVGRTYRLRLINITTARPGMFVEVRRDSSMISWRPLARDAAELPARQKMMRRAEQQLTIGQTRDFEITPREAGDLRLLTTVAANRSVVLGTLLLRVLP